MTRHGSLLIALALALVPALLWPPEAAAQGATTQKQGPFTLSVTAEIHDGRLQMSLADSLRVTIRADGPATLEVQAPAKLMTSPAWQVEPGPAEASKDAARWARSFVINPLAPGQQVLQIEPFRYREKAGPWSTVTWKPILVNVNTQITEADASKLRDITNIEELPPAPSVWDWAKWVLLGLAIAALLLLAVIAWRRRQRPAPVLSPEQWAGRELDRILALDLPAGGEIERFHTLIANVVRRYLENRFALPARRQTTPEFLMAMEKSSHLSDEQRVLLRDFLERCDLAKFAQARPSVEECLITAGMARRFVENASLSPPAVR
jgi:hypothetical protein